MGKDNYLKLSDAKKVTYQSNPWGVNQASFYMEYSGVINEIILSGAHSPRIKIGIGGNYPETAPKLPFAYNAGDRVFISFTYDDLTEASANIKLKCVDN